MVSVLRNEQSIFNFVEASLKGDGVEILHTLVLSWFKTLTGFGFSAGEQESSEWYSDDSQRSAGVTFPGGSKGGHARPVHGVAGVGLAAPGGGGMHRIRVVPGGCAPGCGRAARGPQPLRRIP